MGKIFFLSSKNNMAVLLRFTKDVFPERSLMTCGKTSFGHMRPK